jgi:hypothetical protein
MAALRDAHMDPYDAEGGIFIVANTAAIGDDGPFKADKWMAESTLAMPKMTRDWAFCRFVETKLRLSRKHDFPYADPLLLSTCRNIVLVVQMAYHRKGSLCNSLCSFLQREE